VNHDGRSRRAQVARACVSALQRCSFDGDTCRV
jgi:hypothetical protein